MALRQARIVVIQRDNIGDLVLTTPLLHVLRASLPTTAITVVVNSYNQAILDQNPDADRVLSYVKAKHRAGESLLAVYRRAFGLRRALSQGRFDVALIASGRVSPSSLSLARSSHATHIGGFVADGAIPRVVDLPVHEAALGEMHVVERTQLLAEAVWRVLPPSVPWLGDMPECRVYPQPQTRKAVLDRLTTSASGRGPWIGIHISARKPDQRWPAAHFIELMRLLCKRLPVRLMLLWAPGDDGDARHPGDDAKARGIIEATRDLPVDPVLTNDLPTLIAALSVPKLLVCSDGGAMHIAAALQCPMVCLFGNSDPRMWRPWKSTHVVLRGDTHRVTDIGVDQVLDAAARLWTQPGPVS